MSDVMVCMVMMRKSQMLMSFGMLVGMAMRVSYGRGQGSRRSNHELCYNVT